MKKNRGDIEQAKYQEEQEEKDYPETDMLKRRLSWFQDLKFGVIFHYGLYAKAGIVESWQLSEKDEWARANGAYREDLADLKMDYWHLIRTFDPVALDTEKWAELCQRAGFRYCLFTTKHHDGFNLYNTLETEYKIGGKLSPFKRDILKEVFTSFQKAGLATGAYYSKADWYSPFYWLDDSTIKGRHASYDPQKYPNLWERYVLFVHNQIKEITSNYGPIDFLWLDAGWCGQGKEDLRMDRLAEIARENQPELILVDRMMGGRHENYVTPERKIPAVDEIPSKPWESNLPIGNDWGYVPDDVFKTSQELIETLIEVVSKGGNLVLGVGPTPEGRITTEETSILEEIGEWLDCYGEGIYQTRSAYEKQLGIHAKGNWYFTYHKEKQIHYAFHSILEKLPEIISLSEIRANKDSIIEDLATGKRLTIHGEKEGTHLLSGEIAIPVKGAIGLKIISTDHL